MSKSNDNLITIHTLQNLLYDSYYLIFKVILFSLQNKQKLVYSGYRKMYKISGPYFLVAYKQKHSIRKYLGHKYFTNLTMMFCPTLLKHISFSFYSEIELRDADKVSHYSTHIHKHTHRI